MQGKHEDARLSPPFLIPCAQGEVDGAAQREAFLHDEKAALKAALSAAIAQKEEADMGVAQGVRELAALNNECTNLRHQVRGAWCTVRGARYTVRGAKGKGQGPRCKVQGARGKGRGARGRRRLAVSLEAAVAGRHVCTHTHRTFVSVLACGCALIRKGRRDNDSARICVYTHACVTHCLAWRQLSV